MFAHEIGEHIRLPATNDDDIASLRKDICWCFPFKSAFIIMDH